MRADIAAEAVVGTVAAAEESPAEEVVEEADTAAALVPAPADIAGAADTVEADTAAVASIAAEPAVHIAEDTAAVGTAAVPPAVAASIEAAAAHTAVAGAESVDRVASEPDTVAAVAAGQTYFAEEPLREQAARRRDTPSSRAALHARNVNRPS